MRGPATVSLPSRAPARRVLPAVFVLGVFAGGAMAAAVLLYRLTH